HQLTLEVAVSDAGDDLGDTANLGREVGSHGVDIVGQILPGTGHALHFGLAAELAFGSDFARHARHFRCERVRPTHSGVDGILQLQNLAAHVHGDFCGEIALSDGRRYRGDVADLVSEVRGHRVHRFGELFPGAGDAAHLRLTAELAFGSDLARHARYFRG